MTSLAKVMSLGDNQATEQCPDCLGSGHQETCGAVYVNDRRCLGTLQISPGQCCLKLFRELTPRIWERGLSLL